MKFYKQIEVKKVIEIPFIEARGITMWIINDGTKIPLSKMDSQHIINCYNLITNYTHNGRHGNFSYVEWNQLFHKELKYRVAIYKLKQIKNQLKYQKKIVKLYNII